MKEQFEVRVASDVSRYLQIRFWGLVGEICIPLAKNAVVCIFPRSGFLGEILDFEIYYTCNLFTCVIYVKAYIKL